jgi:subtilase family serine protease
MSIRKVSLGEASSYKLPFFVAMVSVLSLVCSSSVAWAGQDAVQPASSATPRIVEHVDENHLATLTGNTRPEARAEFDRGPVAADFPMSGMLLVLRRSPEQDAAAAAYSASLSDPSSPNFHHWLTASQQGEKFGPAQADIETIKSWLLNHGFTVDEVSKSRLTIRFSGNAAQVETAFHTQIHNLNVKGESHVANMSDPQIPSALTPVVVGVQALHNFFPRPLHKLGAQVRHNAQTGKWERVSALPAATPKVPAIRGAGSTTLVAPQFNTGGTTSGAANIEDVGPYDLATIYNILPLWNASSPIDGTGQTIAIVGISDINPADITTFRSAFGLPAYASATGSTPGFSVIHPNTAPGDCSAGTSSCINDLIESSLDVEWSGAIAKNASIVLVASSPGTGTDYTADPIYVGANYIIENNTANIMNVSYGECELGLGTAGNAGWNALWQTAYTAGIAAFVSTGDEGSASCDAGGDDGGTNVPYGAQFGLSVSGVASTPYDTAVGGTDLNWSWINNGQTTYWNTSNSTTTLASAKGYMPEAPWNDSCTNPFVVSSLNSGNSLNLTATQWCDDIGTEVYTFGSNEDFVLSLVDTDGGSGGVSACTVNDGATVASCSGGYATPSWQSGVTGTSSLTHRSIPDVSFFASNGFSGSAYVICVSNPAVGSCSYSAASEPLGEEIGGTSVSSPIMAGVMALINQKTGQSQGNPNALLYKIAAKETYSSCSSESVPLTGSTCSFNDVDTGTIAMPCDVGSPNCTGTDVYGVLSGYSAAAGYDMATGLGSLNVTNVVNAFAAAAAPAVTFSPTSLNFAGTALGATDPTTQAITLTNTGGGPLHFTGISITGANANSFSEITTCSTSTSVAAGASCTITVTFTPAALGTLTASVSVADDASGSPQAVALTGIGAEVAGATYTLAAAAVTVAPGSSGASAITATGSLGYIGPITVTLSGCTLATSPTGATDQPSCSIGGAAVTFVSGSSAGSGGSVTIATTAATASVKMGQLRGRNEPWRWAGAGGAALAGLLLFGIPARRRAWRTWLGILIFAGMLGALSGCGGGGGSSGGGGGGGNPGTTAGAYTFTLTGTDTDNVKQTVTINVTVS